MRNLRLPGVLTATALTLTALVGTAGTADAATGKYKNCTALQKTYKHGVGKKGAHDRVRGHSKPVTNFKISTKAYKAAIKANSRLDADHDGVACDKR